MQFALVWYLTRETGSATILASATLVALLPQRFLMIVADTGIALASAVLMVLFALGVIQVWHIFVLTFIRSLGGAFHYPAISSSTSLMVPKQQLARVAGMNQTLQGLVTIFAPPLGA